MPQHFFLSFSMVQVLLSFEHHRVFQAGSFQIPCGQSLRLDSLQRNIQPPRYPGRSYIPWDIYSRLLYMISIRKYSKSLFRDPDLCRCLKERGCQKQQDSEKKGHFYFFGHRLYLLCFKKGLTHLNRTTLHQYKEKTKPWSFPFCLCFTSFPRVFLHHISFFHFP